MTRVERLTQAVKTHDRELYCIEDSGKILVCREGTVWDEFYLDGDRYLCSRSVPQVVMAITDNFSQTGNAIDLGIEPLIHRLKSIDLWNDNSKANNVIEDLKKSDETKQKDLRRKSEDFAREWRGEFKKAFSDVNVSSLEKIDKRRNNKWH